MQSKLIPEQSSGLRITKRSLIRRQVRKLLSLLTFLLLAAATHPLYAQQYLTAPVHEESPGGVCGCSSGVMLSCKPGSDSSQPAGICSNPASLASDQIFQQTTNGLNASINSLKSDVVILKRAIKQLSDSNDSLTKRLNDLERPLPH
jgi:hypothetical protein